MLCMNLPKEVDIIPYIRGIEDGFEIITDSNNHLDNFICITETHENGSFLKKYPYILLFGTIKVFIPLHGYIAKNSEGIKWVMTKEYFEQNYVHKNIYTNLISNIK